MRFNMQLPRFGLVWQRLTFSRLTTAYLAFSILHCIIQVAFQLRAFTINAQAANFLFSLSRAGNATDDRIPALSKKDLRLCRDVPGDSQMEDCQVIWSGASDTDVQAVADISSSTVLAQSTPIQSTSSILSLATTTTAPAGVSTPITTGINRGQASIPVVLPAIQTPATPVVTVVVLETAAADLDQEDDSVDEDNEIADRSFVAKRSIGFNTFEQEGITRVNVTEDGKPPVTLSTSCLWSLNWPVSVLGNTKREDIIFIMFQFWVLGMSLVALLNESIPHIIASLLTHIMATAWSTFQIVHTNNFRMNFGRVVANGTCKGATLLPSYWDDRTKAEYAAMSLNLVALLVSAFLTWKLVKLFGWQTFKRVGASLTINRIYKLVLVLSIVIQLSFFFMGATVGLWLDSLFNGIASQVAWYVTLYKASSFITLFLLVPWLMTGWFAVRQEMRVPMFIFLVLSILYTGGWAVMFLSTTFRWTFVTWRFFSLMASASVFLTIVGFVLGVVCRYNFGKGLPRYLNAHQSLGDDFVPTYKGEKVDFPSNEKPIPTYSATFGSGQEVPPPSQMFAGRLGPRFYNANATPFEAAQPPVTVPLPALTRVATDESGPSVHRSDSHNSGKSVGSIASYYSYSQTSHSRNDSQGKRWIIE